METRETVSKRADLAANFQNLVTKPDQVKDFFETFEIPRNQEMVTVPATLEESAVVTMHRMERIGTPVVVLLTYAYDGDHHRAIPFYFSGPRVEQATSGGKIPSVSLESGMSVEDWLRRIDEAGGEALTLADDSQYFAFLGHQIKYETFA